LKLLSFSLWGEDPRYLVGALRNAELAASLYPGWRCRFCCGASVAAETLRRLRAHPHVEVVEMPEPGDWTGLFWRFLAAGDPRVSVMLSRDADSRLNTRERAAVDAWLASDKDVHVMRDHPRHDVPILGGLWGVRNARLREIGPLVAAFPKQNAWQTDQRFLAEVVAPRVREHWLEHDPYFAGRPFPVRRRGREFVGQPFDAQDNPLILGPTENEQRLRDWARRSPRLWRILARARNALSSRR
jgi:hypothetical protein